MGKGKEKKRGKVRVEGDRMMKKVSFKEIGRRSDGKVILELKEEMLGEMKKLKEKWKEKMNKMEE